MRALRQGSRARCGRALFCLALLATAAAPAAWSAEGPPPFAITQLELIFQNGRPDITLPKNFPGLRAYARISFQGTGLLEAHWTVDGRILGNETQPVMLGEVLLLATPRMPVLPTYEPGIHRVVLQVRNPQMRQPLPSITYFVTADEFVPPGQ